VSGTKQKDASQSILTMDLRVWQEMTLCVSPMLYHGLEWDTKRRKRCKACRPVRNDLDLSNKCPLRIGIN